MRITEYLRHLIGLNLAWLKWRLPAPLGPPARSRLTPVCNSHVYPISGFNFGKALDLNYVITIKSKIDPR